MDIDPNNDNERDELLERFRADLALPVAERYYSAADLVTIFDTAGDVGDEYVRSEVLMLAARLYPDDSQLLDRKAIFYRRWVDTDAFDRYMVDRRKADGDNDNNGDILWQIMRMTDFHGTREEAAAMLDEFVRKNRLTADEEVVQFVQLARDLRVEQWLYDNIEMLKTRVDYLPTLLFEIAVAAEADNLHDICISVLEQLTELEPYGLAYWVMLASQCEQAGRHDEACSAVDMALAIDPKSAIAHKMKACIIRSGEDLSDVKNLNEYFAQLTTSFNIDPNDEEVNILILDSLATMLRVELIRIGDIVEICSQIMKANPGSYQVMARAIQYENPDIEQHLHEFFEQHPVDESEWQTLADVAYGGTAYDNTEAVFKVYKEVTGNDLKHNLLRMRMHIDKQQYSLAIILFDSAEEGTTIRRPENTYAALAYAINASLNVCDYKRACELLTTMNDLLEAQNPPAASLLEDYGIRKYIEDCRSVIPEYFK